MRYRHAPLLALLVSMLCVPMAHAQDADPQFTLAEPKHEPGNQQTWVYLATLGKETKKGEAFTLRIRIPERVRVEGSGTNVTVTSRRASPHTEVVVTATKNLAEATPVTVTLTGFAADVKHAQRVEYSWRKGEEDYSRIDRVQGPEVFYDPSFMRFVFGAGASRPRDDAIDFKVKDDHLFVVNDSPWRVTGTVGALFKVGQLRSIGKWKMKEAHPIDLLVSLEFAGQTDRVLDGFMFGMAVGLNKQLSVGGGYSLRLGQELSPRFRRDSVGLLR